MPTTYTCNQIGVCKCKNSICMDYLLADVPEDLSPVDETPTPIEQIAYWGAVAFVGACTVFSVMGLAGYLYIRFGA